MAPLEILSINQCSILSDGYRKGTGENWSDISHIPNIKIDDEYVQRDGRELSGTDETNMHPTPGIFFSSFYFIVFGLNNYYSLFIENCKLI